MRKFVVLALVACVTAACGGDDAGTAPTPSIPNVTGNYSGVTTVVFPELSTSASCPTTTTVTQSGGTVNFAPLVLGGQCANQSIPMGQVSIDATGAILGRSSATQREECGLYNISGSGGFFGRELRISINATSTTCWNMNMTINLSR